MLSGISLLVSTLMRAIRKVVHEKRNARQISERMSMSVMLHAERGEGKRRPEISASFPQGNKENEEESSKRTACATLCKKIADRGLNLHLSFST